MQLSTRDSSILAVRSFAFEAHAGQYRQNAVMTPMRDHLEEVACLVELSKGSIVEIKGGYIHDIFEDTKRTVEEVTEVCGPEATALALALTDPPEVTRIQDSALLNQKKLQANHIRLQSDSAKRVKIADQISNIRSITEYPLLKWGKEQHVEYTAGARIVADVCRGVSEFLDLEFRNTWRKAIASYEQRWPA